MTPHSLHVHSLPRTGNLLLPEAKRLANDPYALTQMQAEIDDATAWLQYVDQPRLDRIDQMYRRDMTQDDWEYRQEVSMTKQVVENYTRTLAEIEASRQGRTKDFFGVDLSLSEAVVYPRSVYGGTSLGVGYVTAIHPNGGIQIRPAKEQNGSYVPSQEKLITIKGHVLKVVL